MRSWLSARPTPAVLLAAIAVALGACGSSSVSVTAPSSPKCQVSATSSMSSVPSAGGSGTVAVDTTRDCTWSAASDATWIAITSEKTGQGDGTVTYHVAENESPSSRQGALTINNQQIDITQRGAPCRYALSTTSVNAAAPGGSFDVEVTADGACPWSATSSDGWITVSTPNGSDSGNGTVTIVVAANSGGARTGTVTIAGQKVTVSQADAQSACTATLGASTASIAAAGGAGQVSVATGNVCRWTATSAAGWITITAGTSGTGPGVVTFTVAANPSASSRQATLTIAGQTFTVTQAAAPCTEAVSPASLAVDPGGGTANVAVTTAPTCAWTVTTADPWITVTSGASGSGNGTVTISAGANPGAARSGTLTIGDQSVTVTQASQPCSYQIAPTGLSATADAGSATVAVTTGAACGWTAASNAAWLTITSGASGTGNGTVTFSIEQNAGPDRTGMLTIAGQVFTVNQAQPSGGGGDSQK